MAGTQGGSSIFYIGDCRVEIEGNNVICDSSRNNLQILVANAATIKISAKYSAKYMTRKSCNNLLLNLQSETESGNSIQKKHSLSEDHSFVLVNPKDADGPGKLLLQDVLKIYAKELPTMNYAANTGKQSQFLERCVFSGKFCTLLLKSNAIKGSGEVIASVTYQIIPVDTQYAEIPVAAVSSNYQHMGIGCLLYMELRKRLQHVGVLTLFCWGDKESEGFWLKQGFVTVGEVDTRGRARRLPIKAEIRRALCFPGGSTLLVAHLNKDTHMPVNPPKLMGLCCNQKPLTKSTPDVLVGSQALIERKAYDDTSRINSPKENDALNSMENPQLQELVKEELSMHVQKYDALAGVFSAGDEIHGYTILAPQNGDDGTFVSTGGAESAKDADHKHCSCSGQGVKRRVWQASLSSLKSKKVKGGHYCGSKPVSDWDLIHECNWRNCADFGLGTSKDKSLVEVISTNSLDCSGLVGNAEEHRLFEFRSTQDNVTEALPSRIECPVVLLMNIADDTKKASLTKIVEELGGAVTSDGSACTHVITGKARRTLNFCTALCSGAWVVSPNWLKSSFRTGRFVDELPFILQDGDYMLKYRSELKDAVLRAQAKPSALLKGYDVCLAMHIQPSVDILSSIVKSAGGNVLSGLEEVQAQQKAIFIACEEDTGEALLAAKKGLWTYSAEWFMSCVMVQQLDFEAPQFAESLI